jgi:uncharacterized membrane protein YgdD (TMEM256/DUF423 family)
MDQRKTLLTAAILGAVAVAVGAFGAHALTQILVDNGREDTFQLAVRYQFYHTLAILAVGTLMNHFQSKHLSTSALCFLGGIIIFSGSLYTLCFTGLGILGAITPIGGLLFILGWFFLFLGILKK